MPRSIVFRFDADNALQSLVERFDSLTPEQIAAATVPALNEVAERTYNLARDRITVGINLSDDYLRRRFKIEKATAKRPVAEITALGADKSKLTPLGRYDAQIQLVPRKTTKPSTGKRGSRNKLPLNGQRQAGVRVEVTRGSPKVMEYAFAMPLRAGRVDGGNGLGVFVRPKGGGKPRHRYGPQVYSMFNTQIEKIDQDVLDDMDATIAEAARRAVEDSLE